MAAKTILDFKDAISMGTLPFGATISIRDVVRSHYTKIINIEWLLLQSERSLWVRSHLATTTCTSHIVSITYYVIRNGLRGYQCYCSHMTTEKKKQNHAVNSS